MKVQEIAGHCGFEKNGIFLLCFQKGGGLYAVAVSPESLAYGQKSLYSGQKMEMESDGNLLKFNNIFINNYGL